MRIIGIGIAVILSLFVALIGAVMIGDGWTLVSLGGSPYFVLAAAALIASGALLAFGKKLGGQIFAALFLATIAWALAETGLFLWGLVPRVLSPVVIGLLVLLVFWVWPTTRSKFGVWGTTAGVAIGALLLVVAGFRQQEDGVYEGEVAALGALPEASGDWLRWGRDDGGSRHVPFTQIAPENVGRLEVAWQLRTGDIAPGNRDQNTPMQVGDTVYLCTPRNVVIAVDADTGEERWRHDPEIEGSFWNRCRGLGYFETTGPAEPSEAAANDPIVDTISCRRRIISTTIDARIFALDAITGARCEAFGEAGIVDLTPGQTRNSPEEYFATSAPTIIEDLIIVGGWVLDNRTLGLPSGVVRAFSAETGELVWAWDLGNPELTTLPEDGSDYTRGTPNVWSHPSVDTENGLVFLPVGNATPDYWGSHRTPEANEYNASVVALDARTGRERWHFRTVNHDIWDYDVPAQPMLIDFPMEGGATRPAVVVLTKRGQIFVLDRLTGAPLIETVQKDVPQNPAPGEYVEATQPYSVGMPAVGAERLTEADMWGATPLDMLSCRIRFKEARYEGEFTPPGVERPAIHYPGNAGGMNWGSGSYDPARRQLVTSVIRMPQTIQLTPTDRPDLQLSNSPKRDPRGRDGIAYAVDNRMMFSSYKLPWNRSEEPERRRPRGEDRSFSLPCIAPPIGMVVGIDLDTREIAWQRPAGDFAVGDIKLAIPFGSPSSAGVITTASGLTFYSSGGGDVLRAYDTETGKVLWDGGLPAGSGAVPMSYVSPKTGRQYVVVSAGGAGFGGEPSDHIVAFALPDEPGD